MNKKIRTRFAPSPTGFLHIGSLRTALYAYALAKHCMGDFILRIEDTDQKREVKGAAKSLCDTLKKFDISWDEYYVQSERHETGIYKKAAEILVKNGHAYYCNCKPKNAKDEGYSLELRDPCRNKNLTSGAVKLKVPEGETLSYYDFVHKKNISWNSDTVYDATLLKSDGFPTYHLAVCVDDLDMNVSHILRGHDWLPSTPIHLLVLEYLGGKRPEIGHLTDILSAQTGKKLSKRRDSVFVEQFIDEGYLPEALLNFIMLLGWAPKDNRELYTLKEFVENFDIDGFQEANPRFLENKLLWMNGEYIKKLSDKEFAKMAIKFAPKNASITQLEKIAPLLKSRIRKFSELSTIAGFFFDTPRINKKIFGKNYRKHIKKTYEVIKNLGEWSLEKVSEELMVEVKKNGFKTGDFFMDIRIAITGAKVTPPINDSIVILGKRETLKRLKELI